jgi:hypothetical protein
VNYKYRKIENLNTSLIKIYIYYRWNYSIIITSYVQKKSGLWHFGAGPQIGGGASCNLLGNFLEE